MCRWAAWLDQPMLIEELHPDNSRFQRLSVDDRLTVSDLPASGGRFRRRRR
jgi:hypothetical protein